MSSGDSSVEVLMQLVMPREYILLSCVRLPMVIRRTWAYKTCQERREEAEIEVEVEDRLLECREATGMAGAVEVRSCSNDQHRGILPRTYVDRL